MSLKTIFAKFLFFLPYFLYSLLIFIDINFVPYLDGGTYFESLINNSRGNFNILNFTTVGHPNFFYFYYLAIFQRFDPGNVYLLHLPNLCIGLLSIFCFWKILKLIFQKNNIFELNLITSIYAIYPVFVANTLNLNLDFALASMYIIFLYLLLYNKHPILIIGSSIFLIFTKEPGILLFIITIVLHTLFFHDQYFDHKKFLRKIIYKIYLLIPILLFLSYIKYKSLLGQQAYWSGGNGEGNFSNISFIDKHFLAVVSNIFILNFNWISSIFIGIGILRKLYLILLNKSNIKVSINKNIIFIFCLYCIIFIIFSSFHTTVNPRYFLIINLLTLIFFYNSICFFSSHIRKLIILITFIIFLFSNKGSYDPISKYIYMELLTLEIMNFIGLLQCQEKLLVMVVIS